MSNSPDMRLYVLVDTGVAPDADMAELARAVADGGATIIQLRDKSPDRRSVVVRARAIRERLVGTNVTFVVNDAVDVALAAGADGVHLGQEDMHPEDARRLLGPDAVIGLTIKNTQNVADAPLEVLDYLAVGGVFATSSKDNPDPPIGLDGLRDIIGAIRDRGFAGPVCAIAGIDDDRIAPVIEAGADGVCIVSAIISDPDPQAAAARMRAAVDRALTTGADA